MGKGDATLEEENVEKCGGEREGPARRAAGELHRRKSYTERKHGESIRFAKRQ